MITEQRGGDEDVYEEAPIEGGGAKVAGVLTQEGEDFNGERNVVSQDAIAFDNLGGTLVFTIIRQHIDEFLELLKSVCEAVAILKLSGGSGPVLNAALSECLNSVDELEPRVVPLCVHVGLNAKSDFDGPWDARQTSTRLATRAPIRKHGDFDEMAAMAWVRGLQARGEGHGSISVLPDVA
jgi:hypothetical protein